MATDSDIMLVERLLNSDKSAFDALYTKYFKLLCATAYFYLKEENEAKDLVQNLFLDIWERKKTLHFHQNIKGYLFLSIKNRSLNHLKTRKVIEKRAQDYHLIQDRMDPVDNDPPKDYYNELTRAMATLKGQRQTALTMVYFDSKKYKEAAEEMGISVNSLKTHLKSGLKVLRKQIK